nr:hypothetical protein [uncultured Flavobacterium sp.]
MFSQAQIYFGIAFAVVFGIAMIYMYRKDLHLHKTYYKGSTWIFIGFLAFIGILFLIKVWLKE